MVRHAPIHRRSGHSDIAICCGRNVRGSSPSTSVVPLSNQVTTLNHKGFKGFKMFSDGHLGLECLGLRGLSYRLLLQGGNFVFSYTLRPAARDYSERMEQAGADRFADLTALHPEKRWQFMQADHPLSAGANDSGRNFSR